MFRPIVFFICLFGLAAFACEKKEAQHAAQAAPLQPIVDENDPATGKPIEKPNKWKNHGCQLLTDEDMKRLFNLDAQAAALQAKSLPDQAFCLRTWNKPNWKERESANEKDPSHWQNPQSRMIIQVLGYGTVVAAKDQFEHLRRDRRDTYPDDVAHVGDDALWSTSTLTLLVRRGHLVLSITLEYLDTPQENFAKAKELAALLLPRIW